MPESPSTAEIARFRRMIVPLMTTEAVAGLGLVMLFAGLRQLSADLGSAAAAGWLITAFILSSAVGGALLGRLGDVIGRRQVLIVVLAAAVAGSLLGCLTRSAGPLIVSRTLQGLVGAAMPLCIGLVRERAPAALVPRGIGLISATASISAGLGLLAGGVIVDLFDWQAVFVVLGVLSALSLFGIWRFVDIDPPRASIAIEDLAGGLLFAPGVVGLLLGIEELGHGGASEAKSWLCLGVALAILGLWVWRELWVAQPLIAVRLLLVPEIALANLAMVFTAFGAFQAGQMMALFGQQPVSAGGLGLSAIGAALLLTPINIAAGFVYARFAGMVARHGPRRMALAGGFLMTASFAGLALLHGSVWIVEFWLVILMIGLGMVFVTVPVVVVAACPPDRVSESTGMVVVIRSTAMAIGAQVVATLLSTHGGAGVHPDESTWRIVFAWGALASLAVALVALRLPSHLKIEGPVNAH